MTAVSMVALILAQRISLHLIIGMRRSGMSRAGMSLIAVLVGVLITRPIVMVGHNGRRGNGLRVHSIAMMPLVVAMVPGLSPDPSTQSGQK